VKGVRFVVAAALVAGLCVAAGATSWTGSLSGPSSSGITGTGEWAASPYSSISWTVSENLSEGVVWSWHYAYTLTVPTTEDSGSISHFIIEATPDTFTEDSFFNATWLFNDEPSPATIEVGYIEAQNQGSGSGNPGIPESLWGVRFNCGDRTGEYTEPYTMTIEFDSWHRPVWGDFYAKDGSTGEVWDAIWNVGFGSPDSDPDAAVADGSVDFHILVPDGRIPEPAAMIFFGTGLVGVLGYVTRRRIQKA
jgi:hypothetical protein